MIENLFPPSSEREEDEEVTPESVGAKRNSIQASLDRTKGDAQEILRRNTARSRAKEGKEASGHDSNVAPATDAQKSQPDLFLPDTNEPDVKPKEPAVEISVAVDKMQPPTNEISPQFELPLIDRNKNKPKDQS